MQCLLKFLCKAGRMQQITLFLSICWILWFSQIFAISTMFRGIQNMPGNPAVIKLGEINSELIKENSNDFENKLIKTTTKTTTPPGTTTATTTINELTNKTIIENHQNPINSVSDSLKTIENDFVILSELKTIKRDTILSHEIPPDERLQKIDDSGGDGGGGGSLANSNNNNINNLNNNQINYEQFDLNENNNTNKQDIPITVSTLPDNINNNNINNNITAEEHPIPVFSEWAQKQMEEAEKQLEKDVNSSTMKKNITNGNKPQMLKLRAKNYASPDCGAKIIASNIEAQNTGALLTTSKDEYMLSPCTNRIWFVVELCEAIQAKQIDLANFELFSSSPKNFTVAVNNRYPTRDWSNVGRFIAEDSRNIQSFELHPHLFGKYVRVDIHSHYNSEHFCPISLFRVYGTSEYEAFETENRNQYDDIDDDVDDTVSAGIDLDHLVNNNDGRIPTGIIHDGIINDNNLKKENQNLFKSASDAVMSIVKKAAQVLVKDKPNENINEQKKNLLCFTPKIGHFECHDRNCDRLFMDKVNNLLSCHYEQLNEMLNINSIRFHLLKSHLCSTKFNINLTLATTNQLENLSLPPPVTNNEQKNRFHLSLIPLDYLAGMCQILSQTSSLINNGQNIKNDYTNDAALNLTIDKKSSINNDNNFMDENNENLEKNRKYRNDNQTNLNEIAHNVPVEDKESSIRTTNIDANEEINEVQSEILSPNLENEHNLQQHQQQQQATDSNENIVDDGVNIFNLINEYEKNDEHHATLNIGKLTENVVDSIEVGTIKNDQIVEIIDSNIDETIIAPSTVQIPSGQSQQTMPVVKTKEIEVDAPSWDTIDKLLSEPGEANANIGGSLSNSGGSYQTNQHKGGHHSESVFIRLSNRIKALERNMSLSGQYLEELSRRYKKQVEELQNSFGKTLIAIEEQNRRAIELEQFLIEQNYVLKENLENLSQKFYFWISILICVVTVVLVHVLISWYSVNLIGKKQGKLLQKYEENSMVQCSRHKNQLSKQMQRRKSVEGVTGHSTPNHKLRRPSEEAMRISGSYKDLMIFEQNDDFVHNVNSHDNHDEGISSTSPGNSNEFSWSKKKFKPPQQIRQRKSSVFYTKENQPFQQMKILNRQESAPGDFASNGITYQNSPQLLLNHQPEIPEDDDYENYIPGSDLAYNEFMPDGPFAENFPQSTKLNGGIFGGKKSSKFRRLSSPGFLKSTFGKSNSNNSGDNETKKKIPSTESTGWEWYRLKKTLDGKNNSTTKIISTTSQDKQHPSNNNIINNNNNKKNSIKPELIVNLISNNGTGGSCGSGGSSTSKNISSNSESEFMVINYSSNNSENGSLRTSNAEDHTIGSVKSDGSDIVSGLFATTNGNNNNNSNKRNAKKQRSFKKMFKKVF